MHPLVGLHLSGNTLTSLDDLASGHGHLGRPIWSAAQLLADLELRLALPRARMLRGARVQEWSKRLAQLGGEVAREKPYFAKAYSVDPTGTAAQLLRLRDELVDAGWDGQPLMGAERLETLSRLEALAHAPPVPSGVADRLVAVEAELRRATHSPYAALDLMDEPELWPGRWRRLFERLSVLGTHIEYVGARLSPVAGDSDLERFQRALSGVAAPENDGRAFGDGSLVVLRGTTSAVLAEPVAALLRTDLEVSTVLIRGLDAGPLDAALARQGLGRQGFASSSRFRPALQVLRLALGVAFVPKNPHRVLELLQLTGGPLAGRAGRRLASAVCERPGIGNALWLGALAELSEDERARVDEWIGMTRLDPSGAPREAVLQIAVRVLGWLVTRAEATGDPSWLAAAEQAGAFVDALRADSRTRLDRFSLEQLLQDLTEEGATSTLVDEEAGRFEHVDSPERLLVTRERVVWWGFVGEPTAPRSTFRAAELEVLRRAGIELGDPRARLRARFEGWVRAVHAARRQLVLVIPEQLAGAPCQPHPLLDELVARLLRTDAGLAALTLSPDELARGEALAARLAPVAADEVSPLALPEGRRAWQIQPALIRPRVAESASSLERLVGCPLGWTLHYQAGLRSNSRGGISGGPLLAGKLGHRLLEELHASGGLVGTLDDVRQSAEGVIDGLIEREGSTLLVAGLGDDRHQLRDELIEAAVAVAALLHENALELVGVEVPVEAQLAGRPLRGSIDVLLRTRDGAERVLDLKYGSGSYAEKLEGGTAIQLAVYAEARRQQSGGETAPPAAYFSIKQQRLLATDAAACFNRHALRGPALSQTGERLENTLAALTRTLDAGRIAVAGVRETAESGLLPLLGVASERAHEHLALSPEESCKYCEFGPICGKSWEQPW